MGGFFHLAYLLSGALFVSVAAHATYNVVALFSMFRDEIKTSAPHNNPEGGEIALS